MLEELLALGNRVKAAKAEDAAISAELRRIIPAATRLGYNRSALSRYLGVSRRTVHYILKDAGFKNRLFHN